MNHDVGDVVLGVDPGAVSGWGLVTVEAAPRLVSFGKIEFAKPRRKEFRTASQCVRWALSTPNEVALVAIEGQYLDRDPKRIASMIKLCRSAGRWVEAAEDAGLKHWEINPTTWQSATLGARFTRDQLKKISRAVCAQRFGVNISHNISDAVLIATYAAVEIYHELKTPPGAYQRPPRRLARGRPPGRRGRILPGRSTKTRTPGATKK
jgi:Holliday junction resolvasome RuvABC endonuclease subunit